MSVRANIMCKLKDDYGLMDVEFVLAQMGWQVSPEHRIEKTRDPEVRKYNLESLRRRSLKDAETTVPSANQDGNQLLA